MALAHGRRKKAAARIMVSVANANVLQNNHPRAESWIAHLVEALGNAVLQDAAPKRRRDCSVCGNDSEHGGHVGVDHAGSLGNAADPHCPPADRRLQAALHLACPAA